MAGEAGTRRGYWGRTYGATQQGPSPSLFSRSSLLPGQTQGCSSLLTSFCQSHVLLQIHTDAVHTESQSACMQTHNAQTNPVHTHTHCTHDAGPYIPCKHMQYTDLMCTRHTHTQFMHTHSVHVCACVCNTCRVYKYTNTM